MVVIFSGAGLANKMFHYALYKALETKDFDVYLNVKSYVISKWSHESVQLKDVFDNIKFKESTKFKRAAKITLFDKIYIHLSSLFGGHYYIYYGFKFNNNIFNFKAKNCCLIGNWQSEKYFENIKDKIRADFRFRDFSDDRNIKISHKMKQENSVAIHIRKGIDYKTNIIFKNTCPIDYYQRAISYIKAHVENPIFYIFTDNKEWVKEHFTNFDYILCDWNPTNGKQNYLDMQLMSCAKHNIIANSTYSWWGAWLNMNPNKIVIAPALWFNPINKLYSQVEIVPQDWITL